MNVSDGSYAEFATTQVDRLLTCMNIYFDHQMTVFGCQKPSLGENASKAVKPSNLKEPRRKVSNLFKNVFN